MNWLSFFANPAVKSIAFALVSVALAVKAVAAPQTIAYHIADQVIPLGVLFGIGSNGVQAQPKDPSL